MEGPHFLPYVRRHRWSIEVRALRYPDECTCELADWKLPPSDQYTQQWMQLGWDLFYVRPTALNCKYDRINYAWTNAYLYLYYQLTASVGRYRAEAVTVTSQTRPRLMTIILPCYNGGDVWQFGDKTCNKKSNVQVYMVCQTCWLQVGCLSICRDDLFLSSNGRTLIAGSNRRILVWGGINSNWSHQPCLLVVWSKRSESVTESFIDTFWSKYLT